MRSLLIGFLAGLGLVSAAYAGPKEDLDTRIQAIESQIEANPNGANVGQARERLARLREQRAALDDTTSTETSDESTGKWSLGGGVVYDSQLGGFVQVAREFENGYEAGVTAGYGRDPSSERDRVATQRNRITGSRLEAVEDTHESYLELGAHVRSPLSENFGVIFNGALLRRRDHRRVTEKLYNRDDELTGSPDPDNDSKSRGSGRLGVGPSYRDGRFSVDAIGGYDTTKGREVRARVRYGF